jgi:hypothetical protein
MRTSASGLALAVIILSACGGAKEDQAAAPVPVAARRRAAADTVTPAAEAGPLTREVFRYSGGSRDPVVSLLASASVGPELPDLTLVAIYIDQREPDRSVAVLREKVTGKRYNLRAGDRLSRLRVVGIRERDVDFIVDDFGAERRETLSLRKPKEEQTP